MSISTIAFLIVYFLGAALALVKDPSYGVITYIFEYYHHPPLHWWGKSLPDLRWSLLISLVALIAYLLRSGSCPYSFLKAPSTKWFLMLLVPVWLVANFSAVLPEKSLEDATNYTKLVLLYFLIIKTIRTPRQYQLFVWMHLFGAFRWGYRAYEHPKLRGGRLEGVGGSDSVDSNYTASHILTVLPFLGYYFLTGKRWEKFACLLIAPFVVNMLILTNSRGSLMGMAAGGIAAVLLSRGGVKFKTILGIVLGAGLFLYLADERFLNRQQTILNPVDESAISRTRFWAAALVMIGDYPFGLGANGFQAMVENYLPDSRGRAVHNTFLQAGTEWGVCGMLFYLAAFGSVFLTLHRIRRRHAHNSATSRVYYEALAIEVGLMSRFAASMFGAEMFHESFYWLAGLTVCLYNGVLTPESIPEVEPDQKPHRVIGAINQWMVQRQIRKAEKRFQ